MEKGKQRYNSFDCLRVFATFGVVSFHCDYLLKPAFSHSISGMIAIIFYHVSCLGLPSFFILTSLALDNEKDYVCTLKMYYLKKLVNPGMAFLIYSVLYFFWAADEKKIFSALHAVAKSETHYHLWYIYSYTGLIVLLPFLKRFLKSLSFEELEKVCAVCFVYRIVITFDFFTIKEFYLGSWVIYYILGYFLLQRKCEKYYKKIILIGMIAFAISSGIHYIGAIDTIWGNALFDLSPLMILQIMALFCVFLKLNKTSYYTKCELLFKKLSKYTLFIYLGHPLIIEMINIRIVTGFALVDHLIVSVMVFIFTLIISIPIGKMFMAMEKLINYLLKADRVEIYDICGLKIIINLEE